MEDVTVEFIGSVAERISPYLHRTATINSQTVNKLAGRNVQFKMESFQKSGSFHVRGALNKVSKGLIM